MRLTEWTDEELLRKGREALQLGRYELARELLGEHCDRLSRQGIAVPEGILASYALALGHTRELKEGIGLCQRALISDRKNPHVYWSLVQLYLLAGTRKKAVEAMEAGLKVAPAHSGLLQIRQQLGVRRPPPIRFLPRNNPVNVFLAKTIHRLRSRRGGKSSR
jgi:tetratricopeptide (TPR) repeat protein